MSARDVRANAVSRRRPISFIIFGKGHNLIHENGAPRVK
jgi:hypothetical protein